MRAPAVTLELACLVVLAGCGGGQSHTNTAAARTLEPPAFLLSYGARATSTLRAPEQDRETLEAAAREGSMDERRAAMRAVAVSYLYEAEGLTEPREARRARQKAVQWAQRAGRGNRDEYLASEVAFIILWVQWRDGLRTARQTGERFTQRHTGAGDLLILAWLIRGEIELEARRWDRAATDFRFVLGMIEHPLYAYALYRTAYCLGNQGREDEASDMLHQVRDMACAEDMAPETAEVAGIAASDLRTPMVTCGARTIPESCGCAEGD